MSEPASRGVQGLGFGGSGRRRGDRSIAALHCCAVNVASTPVLLAG